MERAVSGPPSSVQAPQLARLRGSHSDLYKIHTGSHSVWATLFIAQPPYRTLVGRSVVVVFFEDRLVLRLSATAFSITLHYCDVRQLTYCPLRQALFFTGDAAQQITTHAHDLWASAEAALSTATGRGPIPQPNATNKSRTERLYVLELCSPPSSGCQDIFARVWRALPPPAQQASGEEPSSMDRVLSRLVSGPTSPSLVASQALLAASGLEEMTTATAQTLVLRWAAVAGPSAASAPPTHVQSSAIDDDNTDDKSEGERVSSSLAFDPVARPTHPAPMPTVGLRDVFRIYHAPCPSSWWPRSSPPPPAHAVQRGMTEAHLWPLLRETVDVAHIARPERGVVPLGSAVEGPGQLARQPTRTEYAVGNSTIDPRRANAGVTTGHGATLFDVRYGPSVTL